MESVSLTVKAFQTTYLSSPKDADRIETASLPASVCVWASTPAASFLHGRFIWSNWDVEELAQRETELHEPGYLRIGLQGVEYVDVTNLFDQIREKDASGAQ